MGPAAEVRPAAFPPPNTNADGFPALDKRPGRGAKCLCGVPQHPLRRQLYPASFQYNTTRKVAVQLARIGAWLAHSSIVCRYRRRYRKPSLPEIDRRLRRGLRCTRAGAQMTTSPIVCRARRLEMILLSVILSGRNGLSGWKAQGTGGGLDYLRKSSTSIPACDCASWKLTLPSGFATRDESTPKSRQRPRKAAGPCRSRAPERDPPRADGQLRLLCESRSRVFGVVRVDSGMVALLCAASGVGHAEV